MKKLLTATQLLILFIMAGCASSSGGMLKYTFHNSSYQKNSPEEKLAFKIDKSSCDSQVASLLPGRISAAEMDRQTKIAQAQSEANLYAKLNTQNSAPSSLPFLAGLAQGRANSLAATRVNVAAIERDLMVSCLGNRGWSYTMEKI